MMVFPILHGLIGDGPARAELGGFKKPSGLAEKFCSNCLAENCKVPEIMDGKFVFKSRSTGTEEAANSEFDEKLLPQEITIIQGKQGLSRRSPLWDAPTLPLYQMPLMELMHTEAEGNIIKHVRKLDALLGQNMWDEINKLCASYFKFNNLEPSEISPVISTSNGEPMQTKK